MVIIKIWKILGKKKRTFLGHMKMKKRLKKDYVIVNYSVREKNESFFVSEYEEEAKLHRKKTSFLNILLAVVSYLPIFIKFVM